jgi:pimeloyl-ACP methyl ester carboxylesterase
MPAIAHAMSDDVAHTTITATDGVAFAVDVAGSGEPVVFIHEFSGDRLSWAPQVDALSGRFRCIAFNARGYPPSQVPGSVDAYSQERAADDVVDVMNALGVSTACLVGLSMGGFAALHVAIRRPARVRALVVAGCGYGAKPAQRTEFSGAMNREADHAESIGMAAYAQELACSSYARPLRAKNEAAWRQFVRQLDDHSAKGMAMTLRGVLARRPSLWDLEGELANILQPVLLVIGDEDQPCIEPNLFMKRTLPDSALAVMPRTGHLPNLEEPDDFNRLVERFFTAVCDGSWNRIKASIP